MADTGTPKSNTMANVGLGLDVFSKLSTGINALSTAKFNAGLKRQEGNQQFKTIIGDLHQAVGRYDAEQGASGVNSNSARDVKSAGTSNGIKSAATAQYNSEMQAINLEAIGRAQKAQSIVGAGQSVLTSWGNR